MTRIVLTKTTILKVVEQTLTPTIKFLTIQTETIQIIKKIENPDLSTHFVRPVVKLTIQQRNATLEQTQRTECFPGTDDRKNKIKSNREMPKATQMEMFQLQLKLQTRNATSSLRSCI